MIKAAVLLTILLTVSSLLPHVRSFSICQRTGSLSLHQNSGNRCFQLGYTNHQDSIIDQQSLSLLDNDNLRNTIPFLFDNSQTVKQPTKFELAWMNRYLELQEFYARHGHSNVPLSYPNKKLSRWVTNQRQRRKMNQASMTQERIQALDALHFTWEMKSYDKWEERCLELKEYLRKHGHLDISNTCPKYEKLGKWLAVQIRAYQHGGTGNGKLTEERRQVLESLGVPFDLTCQEKNRFDTAWLSKYQELKTFQDENGHCSVPPYHPLWRWVDTQRIAHRHHQNKERPSMTEERIALLNDVGFIFNPAETKWMNRLGELSSCIQANEHWEVEASKNPGLHTWLNSQYKQFQNSNLSQERILLLKDVGVDLSLTLINGISQKPRRSKTPWNVMYNTLKQYEKENGHCLVPQNFEKNPKLGRFVKAQRRHYKLMTMRKKSSMTDERVRLLNQIGFAWNAKDFKFQPLVRIPLELTLKRSRIHKEYMNQRTYIAEEESKLLLQKYQRLSLWG